MRSAPSSAPILLSLALGLFGPALVACSGGGDDSASTSDTAAETDATGGTTEASATAVTTGDDGTEGTTAGSGASTTTSASTTTGDPGTTSAATDPTDATTTTTGLSDPLMTFFVSSDTHPTGNLGGLAGADKRCQTLADAVGAGDRTWRAYLSAEKGDGDQPVHARDRIGQGPWHNAALELVAANLDELHALDGDHALFLDENGGMVNGQWADSPTPNEHDILTGSDRDGMLLSGLTCADWTSEDAALLAQVGHSDGLGPMMSDAEQYRPWNSVHESGGCNDTAPKGGAGKIYCFAVD